MNAWSRSPLPLTTSLIPLAIIKRHARIFDDESDGYLLDFLLPAAVATVERDTRWQIKPITLTTKLNAGTRLVDLPTGPFVSATLKRIDIDATETDVTDPVTHDGRMPGRVCLPAIAAPHVGLSLSVIVGSQPPEPSIALMICSLIAHWHEHPEAVTADGEAKEVPLGYQHLARALDPMRDAFTIAGGE